MGLRDVFRKKTDSKKAGEAATIDDTDVIANEAPDDTPFGLDVWVQGVDPIVDIIAIHGPNGHREKTWTAKNKVNWLRDANMLSAIIPNARIMSWGYDANTHSTKGLSAMYLYDHAQNLVSDLSLHRRMDKTDTRAIIFVAHSLGGIVLKSALIHSDSARSSHLCHHKSIKTSTYGIMFMGTPHQGGEGVAWGKRLVNVASIFVNTNDKLLNILEQDSQTLQQQLGQYNSISGDFETKFGYETKATPLALGKAMIVVPKSSAVVPGQVDAEPIAIMDHHINMVKFATGNNEFKRVAGHLKLMVDAAPTKVENNWLTERGMESARAGNLKPAFNVAFDLAGVPKTSTFIGRKSDLDLIEKQLMPGKVLDRRKICVIHGLGGMGKTQLAIEYARLHKVLYTSFFWIDGKTEESLIQSLLCIVSRLPKSPVIDVDIQNITGPEESRKAAQEVLKWFALEGNTQWLLIFDNIDKTSYEEESGQQTEISSYDITEYFPGGDTGSIIVTTRLQRLVSLGSQVHLRKLEVLDSLLMLEEYSGRSMKRAGSHTTSNNFDINAWPSDAVSLVKRLGYFPLALVFAGSYISRTTIAEYLELYDKSWNELHETMNNRHDYPERTIITTWQLSFDELKSKDEGAANLLRLWGYLDNEELWYELIQWKYFENSAPNWLQKITATKISFLSAIEVLLSYSLIDYNDDNNETYSMHAVVHDWIRKSINDKNDENLLQISITTIGLAVPENNMREYPMMQRRILLHAMRCSQYCGPICDVSNIGDDMAYMAGLHNLGLLYCNQGHLAEAEVMYERALVGRENALGVEHISTLETVNNLGVLYWRQGRLAEAEAMYERALAGTEKAPIIEHTSMLDTVNNLGILYWNQGHIAKAEAMYERALVGKEKALGVEHTSTLETVSNLAMLYKDQGRLTEAEAMDERALAGMEKALGVEHISTLETVNNLGVLYWRQGRLAEAEAMYERALAGKEKVLDIEHMSTLDTVNNLGILYWNQGRLAKAEAMYERALAGTEKALGVEHTSTLSTVNNLGILYEVQGRLTEAEAMYERALAGKEKALGLEHMSTLNTVNNLGMLYKEQGRLTEAEAMYEQALAGKEKALGLEHTSTLQTVDNLAVLYKDQGRLTEAEALRKRMLGNSNVLQPRPPP